MHKNICSNILRMGEKFLKMSEKKPTKKIPININILIISKLSMLKIKKVINKNKPPVVGNLFEVLIYFLCFEKFKLSRSIFLFWQIFPIKKKIIDKKIISNINYVLIFFFKKFIDKTSTLIIEFIKP